MTAAFIRFPSLGIYEHFSENSSICHKHFFISTDSLLLWTATIVLEVLSAIYPKILRQTRNSFLLFPPKTCLRSGDNI